MQVRGEAASELRSSWDFRLLRAACLGLEGLASREDGWVQMFLDKTVTTFIAFVKFLIYRNVLM